MRNVLAIARRILVQFAHDKRTLGLLFVAPIVVLWLLTVLLGQGNTSPGLPQSIFRPNSRRVW